MFLLRKITITVDISIHTLLAESDDFSFLPIELSRISIHTLLAESDGGGLLSYFGKITFLSTLSLRRATTLIWDVIAVITISIHTLLAESDDFKHLGLLGWLNFYPHSPCGERRESQPPCERPTTDFYPHSPCGERQYFLEVHYYVSYISIHTLLAESDHSTNPKNRKWRSISIHTLLAESDSGYDFGGRVCQGFLSTLSLRRATNADCSCRSARPISIHTLLAESD